MSKLNKQPISSSSADSYYEEDWQRRRESLRKQRSETIRALKKIDKARDLQEAALLEEIRMLREEKKLNGPDAIKDTRQIG